VAAVQQPGGDGMQRDHRRDETVLHAYGCRRRPFDGRSRHRKQRVGNDRAGELEAERARLHCGITCVQDEPVGDRVVRLSGTISTHKAGETVVILGREVDAPAATQVAQTTTGANGDWSVAVRPSVQATFRAQAGTQPSAGVTVNVRPRVGLGVRGRHWTVMVTGRDSFAGSMVLLQRRVGFRWVTIRRVVLGLGSIAHVTTGLHHGTWTVRAMIPTGETGPGYLSGMSHRVRISV